MSDIRDFTTHLMESSGSMLDGKLTGSEELFEAGFKDRLRKEDEGAAGRDNMDTEKTDETPSEFDAETGEISDDTATDEIDDSIDSLDDPGSMDDFADGDMGGAVNAEPDVVPDEEDPADVSSESNIPDKLYLGSNALGDKHFYVVPIRSEVGDTVTDILFQDQDGEKLFSAVESDIDITDFSSALLDMLDVASTDYDLTSISYDVHTDWILPKIVELKHKADAKEEMEQIDEEEEEIISDLESIESPNEAGINQTLHNELEFECKLVKSGKTSCLVESNGKSILLYYPKSIMTLAERSEYIITMLTEAYSMNQRKTKC